MTHPVRPGRLATAYGALSLALTLFLSTGCNTDLPVEPAAQPAEPAAIPLFATSGTITGIVFGSFDLDTELLWQPYNAAVKLPGPADLMGLLANVRSRGARVMVKLSNHDEFVQNSDGTFNLDKWKQQVARFKTLDFQSYITDGTLMGIFLVDEPEDPSNWGGKKISPATVDAMAQYSKSLWPGLTTFVRSKPAYLASTGLKFRYLDAGWAMYQSWQGDVTTWINSQIAAAKQSNIGVIVGLNVLNGGTSASGIKGTKGDLWAMSASQVKSWGTILMNQSYACGFINWQYDDAYNARTDIKAALAYLAQLAQAHAKTPCHGSSTSVPPPPPPPTDSTPVPLPSKTPSGFVYASFDMDNSVMGTPYNASVRLPAPSDVMSLLSGAKAKGGRIVLQLSGLNTAVKNSDGTFSLTKWKTQMDRFKSLNLSSYLTDGTLMGHLLIGRVDARSWGGKAISTATLEAMAQYSKLRWPSLKTFVRADPTYLKAGGTTYNYLDAGWIMYASWKGDAKTWLTAQVTAAKATKLGLVTGMDVLNGGTSASGIKGSTSGKYAMSATQLTNWGGILLNEPYVCSFFNWKYDALYNGRTDIKSAMSTLAQKAKAHATTSCQQ